MPDDGRPIDDDVFDLIQQQVRTGLVPEAASPREHVDRQGERRAVADRRGLGFTARRDDDADRNREQRVFLFAFLRRLPDDTLWAWIDGLLLGNATGAQLAMLVDAAEESARAEASRPRAVGRPRADQILPGASKPLRPLPNAVVRAEWRIVTKAFKTFANYRQRHHAPMNRARSGAPRSLEHRETCRTSPLGQRVENAGLFAEFFDVTRRDGTAPMPAEMAARLLHREHQHDLTRLAADSRDRAVTAPTDARREFWLAQAADADAALKALPTWRTVYHKLRHGP